VKLTWRKAKEWVSALFGYTRCAVDLAAIPPLLILGFVRRRPFSRADLISRLARRCSPTLRIRAKRFGGRSINLDTTDISHAIIAEEFLIDGQYDLTNVKFTPSLILDCGAHIGMFSVLAVSYFPQSKIIAFEPKPKNLRFLESQFARDESNIRIIKAAVSNYTGIGAFTDDVGLAGRLKKNGTAASPTFKVQVVDLLNFIPRGDVSSLLLKMDVEGEEEILLPHIIDALPRTCAIFWEVHRGRASWDELSALLNKRKFSSRIIRERPEWDCIDGFAIRQL